MTTTAVHTSQHVLDWYSPSHFVHGLLLFYALRRAVPRLRASERLFFAVALECAWEVIENSPWVIQRYRDTTIAEGYTGDSIVNSVSDVFAMSCGFVTAATLNDARASIALGVVLELVALVAIRDNLTLNVLMLLAPIDSVKRWQSVS